MIKDFLKIFMRAKNKGATEYPVKNKEIEIWFYWASDNDSNLWLELNKTLTPKAKEI